MTAVVGPAAGSHEGGGHEGGGHEPGGHEPGGSGDQPVRPKAPGQPVTAAQGWDYPAPHQLAVSPQPADIDGLDHTNNAVYVQWCEKVAWSHSVALGLTLDDYRRLDRAMAIRQGQYDYLLPSFEGEALVLGTWLTAGDGKLAMERRFQLRRAADGQTLMRGRWDLVCIEISTGRPRRMPPEFVDIYQAAVV